jgi:toxin ParE1/3/4
VRRVIRHRLADGDLVAIFRYYLREAGLRVADRFFAEAEATFARLAGLPGMGTRYEHDHPALADLCCFPVSRFRNCLVFYRPVADGIEVLRVLHGARDIDNILAEEIGIEEDAESEDEANEAE